MIDSKPMTNDEIPAANSDLLSWQVGVGFCPKN
jgi:hypothetical protein